MEAEMVYDLVLKTVSTFLIFLFMYNFYYNYEMSKKLKWIYRIPGYPIIGNALDFKSTADVIPNIERYMRESRSKTVYSQMLNNHSVITKDYDLMERILSSNSILEKAQSYKFFHNWLGTGLLTAGGNKWRARRKIITPAFHFGVLEEFVDVFDRNGDILIEKLNNQLGNSVNIYFYITLCALDIICESAMGVSVKAQEQSNSQYVQSVKNMCRILINRVISPLKFYNVTYRFFEDYRIEQESLKILHDYTTSVINARKQELNKLKERHYEESVNDWGVKKKTAFLDLLLQAKIDGEPLNMDDIREEVNTFMFEGHDTTASAISFTLFCLANNPDVQETAFEEQQEIFGECFQRATTHRDLTRMKYLEAVIKEALRLYPSVPFYGRALTRNVNFQGHVLPKGTRITLYVYGFHRDPELYPEPNRFNPARYTETNSTTKPYSFLAFSAGPRNCIGQKFAMLEMKSIISKILRNFLLLPAQPEHTLELCAETVLKSRNGINIKLEKRK